MSRRVVLVYHRHRSNRKVVRKLRIATQATDK